MYFLIFAIGNGVAAVLSTTVVSLSPKLLVLTPFLNGFLGVFAFQGIMSNTNITVLDKGVLTIQDWTEKSGKDALSTAVYC